MRRERIGAAARYILTAVLLTVLFLLGGNVWVLSLLVLLALIPTVSTAANFYVRRHLRGEMQLPTTAAKGTACMGSLIVHNQAWLPAMKLQCSIAIINDLTREQQVVSFITAAGPRRKARQDFLLQSVHCGRLYVQVQSVKIMDYFGLIAIKVPMKAASRITILPEMFPCEIYAAPVAASADDGSASRRGDDRTEVFQMREYQSGDDIRQIHWKLSSKLDTLILREPSQSVSRSVLLFWDKRCACSPENMDTQAEAVASVSQALCDSGIPFDLGWTEGEELELRQIPDEDVLLQTIPALVTQAGLPDCPAPDVEEYGRVIYVTSQASQENIGDQVHFLVCSDQEYEEAGHMVFTALNYKERLERLEI